MRTCCSGSQPAGPPSASRPVSVCRSAPSSYVPDFAPENYRCGVFFPLIILILIPIIYCNLIYFISIFVKASNSIGFIRTILFPVYFNSLVFVLALYLVGFLCCCGVVVVVFWGGSF